MSSRNDLDAKFGQWGNRIAEAAKIVQELLDLDWTFKRSMELIDKSGRPVNYAYGWLSAMCARDLVVQLRRVLDKTKRVRSLWHLLESIRANPTALSRARVKAVYARGVTSGQSATYLDMGDEKFTQFFGASPLHCHKSFVESDLEDLRKVWVDTNLKDLADKRIIHNSPHEKIGDLPPWRDVHRAVKTTARITRKYNLLLTATDWPRFVKAPHVDQQLADFWL